MRVPGIVGVVLGCPDGCGAVFSVAAAAVETEPASRGRLTATVQITADAVIGAYAEHMAEHGEPAPPPWNALGG